MALASEFPMLRILLVEDNQIFRKLFRENFWCFPSLIFEEAANGEEALQKVNGNPPGLILTDLRLPGMNGLQMNQEIKKNFPQIPIAILTGYDLPEYKEAAIKSGADHFFVKGSSMWEEIEAFIEAMIQRQEVR